jgi:ABC transporter substrate binding protein
VNVEPTPARSSPRSGPVAPNTPPASDRFADGDNCRAAVALVKFTMGPRRSSLGMTGIALQEEADANGPVLSLMADLEDERYHLRRRLEGVVARPTLLGPEAGKPDLPVPAQPEVELTTGDPEKAARLTDVPGDLAAEAKRLQIQSVGVSDPNELDGALATMTGERLGALLVLQDLMLQAHRRQIVDFVARNRLPAMYERKTWVDAGGLMSYGVSFPDNFRRAATYVDKILRGSKPADLPVEHPTKFELIINMKTARALGLTIPQSILLRADQVLQ